MGKQYSIFKINSFFNTANYLVNHFSEHFKVIILILVYVLYYPIIIVFRSCYSVYVLNSNNILFYDEPITLLYSLLTIETRQMLFSRVLFLLVH